MAYSSSEKRQAAATALPGVCSLCPPSRCSAAAPLQTPGTETVLRTLKTKVFSIWVVQLGLLWVWAFFTASIWKPQVFFLIQTCPCTAANCENGSRRRNSLNATAIKTRISVDGAD